MIAELVDQIGRELKVSYVLEGSLQREGDATGISAQLVAGGDQTQLWSDPYRYNGSPLGMVPFERDVAQRVAHALAIQETPAQQATLGRPPTSNSDAYEAYLICWLQLESEDSCRAEEGDRVL